jgi:uncharacterized protein (DUF1015 family)
VSHLDRDLVLDRLRATFDVDEFPASDVAARVSAPTAGISLVALGLRPGRGHRLVVRPDADLARLLPDVPPVLRQLDTLILQRLVFEAALGLSPRDAESGERVGYTRDPDEAARAFEAGEADFVFFLSPTPLALIRSAMREGTRMPQKTTYFYPKPVTGLVFFDHDVAWR